MDARWARFECKDGKEQGLGGRQLLPSDMVLDRRCPKQHLVLV